MDYTWSIKYLEQWKAMIFLIIISLSFKDNISIFNKGKNWFWNLVLDYIQTDKFIGGWNLPPLSGNSVLEKLVSIKKLQLILYLWYNFSKQHTSCFFTEFLIPFDFFKDTIDWILASVHFAYSTKWYLCSRRLQYFNRS